MKLKEKFNISLLVILWAVFLLTGSMAYAKSIHPDVPEKIDKKAHYLFYLHGRIVEISGIRPTSAKYGVYEYEKILEALKDKGFIVISEARKGKVNSTAYAKKVAFQIDTLRKAGVPSGNITVVGASKGALIAMQVSTILADKDVNYVIMAGCSDGVYYRYDIDLYGNILSIYDHKDELVGSCQRFVDKSSGVQKYKEIVTKVGTGHGILYKPLKEWLDPVTKWAKGKK
ncbi:MAG: alpha/beta hydrolase [bacterium]|nr:alpha/beta hydrolase [bacterium]